MFRTLLLLSLIVFYVSSCSQQSENASSGKVPRGYYQTLEVVHKGAKLTFGPFVGYYFRPADGKDLTKLEFLCFNEDSFYTQDLPPDSQLFTGEAILAVLPDTAPIPPAKQRINPIFLKDADPAWRASRPAPQDEFVHFHSMYDAGGAVYAGYWLRHNATEEFTYDMGGRLSSQSPLYHQARPELQADFPGIVEFDYGPTWSPQL